MYSGCVAIPTSYTDNGSVLDPTQEAVCACGTRRIYQHIVGAIIKHLADRNHQLVEVWVRYLECALVVYALDQICSTPPRFASSGVDHKLFGAPHNLLDSCFGEASVRCTAQVRCPPHPIWRVRAANLDRRGPEYSFDLRV